MKEMNTDEDDVCLLLKYCHVKVKSTTDNRTIEVSKFLPSYITIITVLSRISFALGCRMHYHSSLTKNLNNDATYEATPVINLLINKSSVCQYD